MADGAMVPEPIFLCARAHYPIHHTTMYLHRWNTLRACVVVQSIRSHGKRTRAIYVYICVLQHISQCNTQEQWSVQTHTNNMFSLCVLHIDVNECGNDRAHFPKKNATTRQPMCGLVLACSADGAMVPEQNKILCARASHPIHPTIICLHRWNTLRGCVVVEPANNTQTNKQTIQPNCVCVRTGL